MVTKQQIEAFSEFAKSRIESGTQASSLAELVDEWLVEYPPADDMLAIQASLRDMDAGETGRAFDDFVSDFRIRNGISGPRCP